MSYFADKEYRCENCEAVYLDQNFHGLCSDCYVCYGCKKYTKHGESHFFYEFKFDMTRPPSLVFCNSCNEKLKPSNET